MTEPKTIDRYLGCKHVLGVEKSPTYGTYVNAMTYDMSHFLNTVYKSMRNLRRLTLIKKPPYSVYS